MDEKSAVKAESGGPVYMAMLIAMRRRRGESNEISVVNFSKVENPKVDTGMVSLDRARGVGHIWIPVFDHSTGRTARRRGSTYTIIWARDLRVGRNALIVLRSSELRSVGSFFLSRVLAPTLQVYHFSSPASRGGARLSTFLPFVDPGRET